MSARVFHQVVYVTQITSLTLLLLCLNLLRRHEKHINVLTYYKPISGSHPKLDYNST